MSRRAGVWNRHELLALPFALLMIIGGAGGRNNSTSGVGDGASTSAVLRPSLLLDTSTKVPGSQGGATLVSFSSPRIEDGSILFDGEAGSGKTGVFGAEGSGSSGSGLVVRTLAWSGANDGSLYSGSGGAGTIAFIGMSPNASGLYVASTLQGAAPQLVVRSGDVLPGTPGHIIGPAVGHGLRDVDTNANASEGVLFVALTDQSFGIFLAQTATASSGHSATTAISVNGSTPLPGCPPGHATIGAVGVAPMLGSGALFASFYAGNGEMTTMSTACEGIYTWCRRCQTAIDVVADTQRQAAAPVTGGSSGARFTAFGQSSIAASVDDVATADVAFYADSKSISSGAVRRGVYLQPAAAGRSRWQSHSIRPPLQLVADTTMIAPPHTPSRDVNQRPYFTQNFTSFDAVTVHSGAVVFRAQVQGQQGIYLRDRSGSIHVVVNAQTPAPPPANPRSRFQYVELSSRAFDGRYVVFYALVGAGPGSQEDTNGHRAAALPLSKGLWYVDVSHITLGTA